MIVIGGDNGEAFYEHGFAAHASSLFNEVMKVPMIIRAPGLQPGLDARPAMFLDVPPSVFDLLGLPPHPGFQGISLFEPQPESRSIDLHDRPDAGGLPVRDRSIRVSSCCIRNGTDGTFSTTW